MNSLNPFHVRAWLFLLVDFAVGAPYAKNGDNTGVVYIYYGQNNRTVFENQQPFEVNSELCSCVHAYNS